MDATSRPRRPFAALFLVAAPALLGGCATLFTGTSDTLAFDASVPGVRLSIDGHVEGELPLQIEMSRSFVGGQQFVARFERDGYQPQEFKLTREFNTVAILDVSSTIVSGGVDVLTGSLMRFAPRAYHVQMLPVGADPRSVRVRRGAELRRFALVNFRDLQRDLARGGGEHLATFAGMLGDGDEAAVARIEEASCRAAPGLLRATSAPRFLDAFDPLLLGRDDLRTHAL